MILRFRIHYYTQWGEQLFVSGNLPELGENEPFRAFPMEHVGDGTLGSNPLASSASNDTHYL